MRSKKHKQNVKSYRDYLHKNSPNYFSLNFISSLGNFNSTDVCALLGEAFLQLLVASRKIECHIKQRFFKAYLEQKLEIAPYENLLSDLIGRFSRESLLGSANAMPDFCVHYVPFEDTLGFMYEALLELHEDTHEDSYYTSESLTDTVLETLLVTSERRFFDPMCGSGIFLLRLMRRGAKTENLYGCDLDETVVHLARMNVLLSSRTPLDYQFLCEHFFIGDSLLQTKLPKVDVIVGNPPFSLFYDEEQTAHYAENLSCARRKHPCLADLFVERALQHLDENGMLQFILPESLLHVASHREVRQCIFEMARVKAVRYLGEVFHAVQCQSIVLSLEKTKFSGALGDVIVNTPYSSYIVRRKRDALDFNFQYTDQEDKILKTMEHSERCVRLKSQVYFAMGIVSGKNQELLIKKNDPAFTKKNYEPVLMGPDIEPFVVNCPQSYILFDKNSLQQVAKEDYYRKSPKLVYRFIAKYPIVAIDTQGFLTLNSCNILILNPASPFSAAYLCAVLNSSAVRFYFEKKFHTIKILRSFLEEVPVPLVSAEEMLLIEFMVDEYLKSGGENKQLQKRRIDRRIAEYFGLGKRGLKLTDQGRESPRF